MNPSSPCRITALFSVPGASPKKCNAGGQGPVTVRAHANIARTSAGGNSENIWYQVSSDCQQQDSHIRSLFVSVLDSSIYAWLQNSLCNQKLFIISPVFSRIYQQSVFSPSQSLAKLSITLLRGYLFISDFVKYIFQIFRDWWSEASQRWGKEAAPGARSWGTLTSPPAGS